MRRIINGIIFMLVIGALFFCNRLSAASENIVVHIAGKGADETGFSFTSNDIEETLVRMSGRGYGVIITLNKSLWATWNKFTSDNIGQKFEIVVDNNVTNEGTIRAPIDGGVMCIKTFGDNKKEAEAYVSKFNKKIAYEDTRMRDQNLLQATVYVNKGMRHLDNREFKQAVIEYTEAIKLDKSDPKVYYYRGLANMMQNESDNALTDFSKAIQMNPNLAEAYNNRAVIYLSKKGYKKCEEDINKAEELGYKINPKLIEELNKARAQK